ncbi:DNA/RNA non-specific endonuclease [Tetragenococcus halophilus]|uniref:DNA/RNA non-specific endonuclease n=1 Tax=Tetragenococcus halophilus TaxID=51669 RepID=UPI000B92859D|nr:DNA/RNA non-specific endonuclease [Tetragenococcus halophilus]MCO7026075.1 DNA/RNA non-specific endonuclease [Tetragenococcus halophilus]QXN87470.1 DNA/RNA non-specific endonuclease [Tetragenococcus halophilus]GBD61104.1 putative endonuclease [Tetragenococcus halophilus subsp. halophilus]GBD72920.1 putative endonuclease [Tetragenococcus halophilus subsp. halophilus]GBD75569.1 putative endonuclease [Tetragenococcus halophilus subsp. halophilus]
MAYKRKKTRPKTVKALLSSLVLLLLFTATAGNVDLSKIDFNDFGSVVEAFETQNNTADYSQLENLPEYNGEDELVTLNKDQPFFTEEELSLEEGAWQSFSNLDRMNRVGPANAMLHKKMMPEQERGDISEVYPSGWKQKKIAGGQWLYNRSHLIGFQLTGEDDNWKNLFTGTQQMNQGPMREYEEEVADYLKETQHHVRYRVTPLFKENDLVPRGIEMEAQSIEDDQLQFNVYIYNIQDSYQINYETGTSKKDS